MGLPVGPIPVFQRLVIHPRRDGNLIPFHRIEGRVAKEETGVLIEGFVELDMRHVVDEGDAVLQRLIEMAVGDGEVRILKAESSFSDTQHFAPYRCQVQLQLKTK
jgi:hypothetical protein